jgi:ribonuclease HI
LEEIDLNDSIWDIHFDGSCLNEGNVAGIVLIYHVGKVYNFFYRLEFSCMTNVTDLEALLLGIENSCNLGYGHLSIFRDSELVVNLVRKI